MRARHIALAATASLLLTLAACSSGGSDSSDKETDGDATTTEAASADESIDPADVEVFTSEEVCDLVSADEMGEALGSEVTDVSAPDLGTPQCSYQYTTADGTVGSITTAVQRPVEDLGDAAGDDGFEYATSIVISDTPYEDIDGLGDRAAITSSESITQVVVLAEGQVFTVAGTVPATPEMVQAAAAAVADGLA